MQDNGTQAKRGELPCMLVFSEREHVDHIYVILEIIENTLRRRNFKPRQLGDDIRSGQDYLKKLHELIDDSVLGIIILDGFRPNVLFEFGFLTGKRKKLIILQSKKACINIKSLFPDAKESGLTQSQFSKLKLPFLSISQHLSDFAGKHIAYFDWGAKLTDPLHVSNILIKELEKLENEIQNEIEIIKRRGIHANILDSVTNPL